MNIQKYEGRLWHDLAKFNQSKNIPQEYRLELEDMVKNIVEYALKLQKEKESRVGTKLYRFFAFLTGKKIVCKNCDTTYHV